ncbi:MAG: hypothetical protein ACKVWV_07985 [Planctomycetota bacterium]
MQTKRLLLSVGLLVPALLAFRLPAAKVRFAPAEGSSTVKTFESKGEFTLDSMSMTMNGSEMPEMDMSMTVTSNQKIVVTDDYVALREGGTKTLKRRFDEIGNETAIAFKVEAMGQSQSNDKTVQSKSELTGKTVVFSWDDDSYKKAFDPAEDNETLLEGLDEDMDLRVLLPKNEVKEGEEWTLDVKTLVPLLVPGGNLSLKPEDSDEGDDMGMGMPGMGGNMSEWLSDLLEGDAKAKFLGERTVDDTKVAAIQVTIKIKSSKDISALVQEQLEKSKLPAVDSMNLDSMDVELEIEGEGELLWDLAKGRAHSFELSGPARMTMDMSMKLGVQGQTMSMQQSMQMSGTTNVTAKFE